MTPNYSATPTAQHRRRVIGPVPPRDKQGRMLLKPILGERVKVNALGEPLRDKDNQPIMETVDMRDPRDLFGLIVGEELADGATKGLSLFEVDLSPSDPRDAVPEPLMRVYAKDEAHAEKVWMGEMGITGWNSTLHTLRVTKVEGV